MSSIDIVLMSPRNLMIPYDGTTESGVSDQDWKFKITLDGKPHAGGIGLELESDNDVLFWRQGVSSMVKEDGILIIPAGAVAAKKVAEGRLILTDNQTNTNKAFNIDVKREHEIEISLVSPKKLEVSYDDSLESGASDQDWKFQITLDGKPRAGGIALELESDEEVFFWRSGVSSMVKEDGILIIPAGAVAAKKVAEGRLILTDNQTNTHKKFNIDVKREHKIDISLVSPKKLVVSYDDTLGSGASDQDWKFEMTLDGKPYAGKIGLELGPDDTFFWQHTVDPMVKEDGILTVPAGAVKTKRVAQGELQLTTKANVKDTFEIDVIRSHEIEISLLSPEKLVISYNRADQNWVSDKDWKFKMTLDGKSHAGGIAVELESPDDVLFWRSGVGSMVKDDGILTIPAGAVEAKHGAGGVLILTNTETSIHAYFPIEVDKH